MIIRIMTCYDELKIQERNSDIFFFFLSLKDVTASAA